MGEPSEFEYSTRRDGTVLITQQGRRATVLRGKAAARFLVKVDQSNGQALMARVTGNYKRGNERS